MMKPQIRNSYEFRLVQVSSYSDQAVLSIFWIKFRLRGFAIYQSGSWLDHETTIYLVNKHRKYFVFSEFTNELSFFFTNSLSFSRIPFEFTYFLLNSLWIHTLFHEITIYFANIMWIHYKFTVFFCIHYELTFF